MAVAPVGSEGSVTDGTFPGATVSWIDTDAAGDPAPIVVSPCKWVNV